MSELQITIPGTPIAKKRPRFVRRGKFVGTYNCQQTEEGRWLWEVTQQLGPDFGIFDGMPLELDISFFLPIPKSTPKKLDLRGEPHTKKPDVDNLIKFALDCLNGVLFADDRQIYTITGRKFYADKPQTQITVRWEEC